jgi:hypothetical protein
MIQQTIRATGMTPDEVLADLVSQRQSLYEDLYAKRDIRFHITITILPPKNQYYQTPCTSCFASHFIPRQPESQRKLNH